MYWQEHTGRLLARRGRFILVRYGCDEFTVYESPYPQYECWGCASYGLTFESIGHAIQNLTERGKKGSTY